MPQNKKTRNELMETYDKVELNVNFLKYICLVITVNQRRAYKIWNCIEFWGNIK